MKVLFLAASGNIAGGNVFLLTLVAALQDIGVQCHIAIPAAGDMLEKTRKLGFAHTVLPQHQPDIRSPIKTWQARNQWRKLIDALQPDVIHANDLLSYRAISLAVKHLKIPLIAHIHFHRELDFCQWIFKNARHPDTVIFCSHKTQDATGPILRQACPDSEQAVVLNAIDLRSFQAQPAARPTSPMVIGIIANLIPRKRQQDMLTAAKILVDKGYDLKLEFIGRDIEGGQYQALLEQMVESLSLQPYVNFVGYSNQVASLIQSWSVAVCCADHEELPVSLIEAAATGLPIVSTDVGGISEIVEEGQSGYLIPTRSPEILAEKLQTLLDAPELLAQFSQRAADIAQQKFDKAKMAEHMRDIYQRALQA